jgi:hypothetical protein
MIPQLRVLTLLNNTIRVVCNFAFFEYRTADVVYKATNKNGNNDYHQAAET